MSKWIDNIGKVAFGVNGAIAKDLAGYPEDHYDLNQDDDAENDGLDTDDDVKMLICPPMQLELRGNLFEIRDQVHARTFEYCPPESSMFLWRKRRSNS